MDLFVNIETWDDVPLITGGGHDTGPDPAADSPGHQHGLRGQAGRERMKNITYEYTSVECFRLGWIDFALSALLTGKQVEGG